MLKYLAISCHVLNFFAKRPWGYSYFLTPGFDLGIVRIQVAHAN